MGFNRHLFDDPNVESFICVKCEDVAMLPVTKSCCDSILCEKCFIGFNCENVSCRTKRDTSALPKQLLERKSKEYFSLKLKCIDCTKIVTIRTLGTHNEGCLRKKYDETRAASDTFYHQKSALKNENYKLQLKIKELMEAKKQDIAAAQQSRSNGNIYNDQIQQNSNHGRNSVKRKSFESFQDEERPSSSAAPVRPSTSTPPVRSPPPSSKPSGSMPIVVIDTLKSESVPHGAIELLKQLILAGCTDGKYPELNKFFKPVEMGMNKRFGGNWRTFAAQSFDPEKARCRPDREIHYSIQWIEPYRRTFHVTFDHPQKIY